MSEVEDLLLVAFDRIAQLESRYERTFRYGKVLDDSDVDVSDPTRPRARIHVDDDEDGNPVKGPMVPFATLAGNRNQHSAPSTGQQFLMIAPDGEFEAGLLVPLGHSNDVPSPSSDPNDYVDGAGKTDKRFKDGKDRTAVGDTSEHLIVDQAQRITVASRTQFVLKFGDQVFVLKEDALEPGQDIGDYA